MHWIAHLSVRAKLMLMLVVASLGLLAVSVTSWWALREAVQASQQLVMSEVSAVRTVGDLRADVGHLRRYEKDLFLNLAEEALLEDYFAKWSAVQAKTLEHIAVLQTQLPTETQVLEQMKEGLARYAEGVKGIHLKITRGEINDPWAANKAMEPAKADIRAADAAFAQVTQAAAQRAQFTMAQLDDLQRRATAWVIAAALTALVLAMSLGYWLASRITRPLAQAAQAVERVAAGDLSQQVNAQGSDETARMLQSVQRMQGSLSQIVRDIRQGIDAMTHASTEIAMGNQDLSSRTEQTASNLEETAASMEQLTSTVRNSADAARQANQLAASAAQIASRGGEVVSQVVSTMDEINHSSKKINDIIGVIDGIAFQTNILALNAAVEAARAGEQGRGFAVVAGEVRNLAQRSAQAAKEIKGLIGASVERVEAGSRLVADAGQTMNEIVGSVQRVSDIIGEITAAAGEQSDGIAQVNTAVSQLDQMTQQNAALVEQSAAAAQSLKEQAARLAETVQVFSPQGLSQPAASTNHPTAHREAETAKAHRG